MVDNFDPTSIDIPLSYPRKHYISIVEEIHGEFVFVARIYAHGSRSHELADVWLRPDLRGKRTPEGVKWSRRLMLAVLSTAKKSGIKKIWLWTTEDNIAAVKLYKRFGFVERQMPVRQGQLLRKKHPWLKKRIGLVKMTLTIK